MTSTTLNDNGMGRLRCNALRGLAITAIIIHNFVHLYPGMLEENEFGYMARRATAFAHLLSQPDWMTPLQLLSYLGHYGMVVFLFLSGYGLVKRYERPHEQQPGAWSFIVRHYGKLLKLLLPALLVTGIITALHSGFAAFTWRRAVAQMLFVTNLFPNNSQLFIFVPWWFMGMILQLYVVYALVLRAAPDAPSWRRYGIPIALTIASWLAMRWIKPDGVAMLWLRMNCIGQVLAFATGIMVARCEADLSTTNDNRVKQAVRTLSGLEGKRHPLLDTLVALCALAAVAVGSLNVHAWLWVPLAATVAGCALVRLGGATLLRALAWLGGLSAALFVTHPLVRRMFMLKLDNMWLALGLYLIACVVVAIPYRWLLQWLSRHVKTH